MKNTPDYVPMHNIETKEMHPMGFDIIDLDGKGGKQYDSSQMHRHTFFELFFFTGGSGNHQIDFMHYPVAKNSVHFVSPGQIHKLSLRKTRGFVLCFTEDFISLQANENFIEKFPFYDGSGHPVISLGKAMNDELEQLISAINREFEIPGNGTEILRSYMNILLLKIRQSFSEQAHNKAAPAAARNAKVVSFRNRINEDYLEHRSVADYASKLNISPNHLNALCKLHEGKTAIQMLQDRLLLEAKRLLYATDMNIKEIAFRLNFEDVAYFNRFFKKQTQITPVQYRQRSQENR